MFKYIRNALLIAATIAIVGCEGGDDNNGGPYGNITSTGSSSSSSATINSDIVGTWALTDTAAGTVWYIHFKKDATWRITNDSAGNIMRVYGTYTYSGNEFQGPMINPGVGEGKIGGNITDGSMILHFKEYWHTPHKVVDYTGTKIK